MVDFNSLKALMEAKASKVRKVEHTPQEIVDVVVEYFNKLSTENVEDIKVFKFTATGFKAVGMCENNKIQFIAINKDTEIFFKATFEDDTTFEHEFKGEEADTLIKAIDRIIEMGDDLGITIDAKDELEKILPSALEELKKSNFTVFVKILNTIKKLVGPHYNKLSIERNGSVLKICDGINRIVTIIEGSPIKYTLDGENYITPKGPELEIVKMVIKEADNTAAQEEDPIGNLIRKLINE